MFLELDKQPPLSTAIIDDQGHIMTYGELCSFSGTFYAQINRRTLIFILCENQAAVVAGYVACLNERVVPLLISATMDRQLLDNLIEIYHPEYLWLPQVQQEHFPYRPVFDSLGYTLVATDLTPYELYPDLSLLLTTSGSTGSPKFVRHSYQNVEANARNVARVFEMNESESGMVSLPLQFTQGLNVASSHLYGGATILLSTATLTQKEFWNFFKEYHATSFTGVPYSIEVLSRLRFFRMDLPDFKTLNQGGGRLTDELFKQCAEYADRTGRRFIATYGSTETTSRMAYLPPDLAMIKTGSIGRALPEGTLTLVDDDGSEITETGAIGEIVYKGPNVTLGYAECGEDLMLGDERQGVYATGDQAWRDEDGCHFIVGRKKRFLKLYGYRIGLDETERLIKGAFSMECACTGTDKKLLIYVTDDTRQKEILNFIVDKTGVYHSAFEVRKVEQIPKNDAGKILYEKLPK
jgi:long-chain acyl-CoA synthetase